MYADKLIRMQEIKIFEIRMNGYVDMMSLSQQIYDMKPKKRALKLTSFYNFKKLKVHVIIGIH